MAEPDLIAEYVTALRASLRAHPDVDDVAAEVDDHLRCAAHRLQVQGVEAATAHRDVLARFGDATLVANAFASTATGGTAMPTRLTRTAGTFALLASIAWLAVAPAALIGAGSADWERHYVTLAVTVFAASTCTTVALFGFLRRAGSTGVLAAIAMTLAILGTVVLGVATWAWLLGVGFLTIASAIAVLRMRRAGVGTPLAHLLLVAAWPVGAAVAVVLEPLQVGPIDSYGNAYLGQLIGLATGGLLYASGLSMSGRWLRREAVLDAADVVADDPRGPSGEATIVARSASRWLGAGLAMLAGAVAIPLVDGGELSEAWWSVMAGLALLGLAVLVTGVVRLATRPTGRIPA